MANIYIAATSFANPPGKKQARELRASWPQITGFTSSPDGPIYVDGVQQPPGYVIHTSNPDPDPDEAAIIADAIALSDGSTDPAPFGVQIPIIEDVASLPAQPPDWPDDRALLVAVASPPGLYAWARGAWRGPF